MTISVHVETHFQSRVVRTKSDIYDLYQCTYQDYHNLVTTVVSIITDPAVRNTIHLVLTKEKITWANDNTNVEMQMIFLFRSL
jgi:hypothetical protein